VTAPLSPFRSCSAIFPNAAPTAGLTACEAARRSFSFTML